ncbi:Aldehyde ferredoxin oxidoreductase, domains 2 & 3 [Neomoorella glycerini]|uniref:Aldehyde ferredoxin oxidoreductase, domains 2 & 3 n=1 Tax=Neomoorella glycerini TaxID=55779 RepID=A0A6I5ZT73_9FIRM|nr:aldehyde ferredoxin oxidoreductase family protein [Moorella glycerini]QGP93110.1 Aldehyde ferredoxin oxidoreductase, domains 2 & 3 [Moorella glycerini]
MARFGTLLRINLTLEQAREEEINPDVLEQFVGGKGLGAWYLFNEIPTGCDPLGEENKLFMAPGVLSGTPAPGASKYFVVTKSPLTGIFLDTNSGGHFGPELKATGHDLVIIEGRASRPTWIYIENDKVSFIAAEDLWGKGIYETETIIRERLKDPRVRCASIGPAGENLVRYACIANDYSRHLGRGGAGAVMGSKNLKAIAVRGWQDVKVARPELFEQAVKAAVAWVMQNGWVALKRRWGTSEAVEIMNQQGIWPVNNFSATTFEGVDRINHEAFDRGLVRRLACATCPVACSKGYRDTTYTGGEVEGPEFETITLLGANLGLADPQAIAAANYLCNNYGLDTISTGAVIGLVLDGLRQGKLTQNQLGLPENKTGVELVLWLVNAIARRQGCGDLLAQGSRRMAEELGLGDTAPQVKGMEMSAYDPRASYGIGLAYQTSDRGACHLRTWPIGREISGELPPRNSIEGKPEFVKRQQDEKAAQECLGVCQFPYGIGLLGDELINLLNAAIGTNFTVDSFRRVGERIWNLARLFNVREGLSRKDDLLPLKFSIEPLPDGLSRGKTLSYPLQEQMLDRYYQLRGWDEDGIPSAAKLQELGLQLKVPGGK